MKKFSLSEALKDPPVPLSGSLLKKPKRGRRRKIQRPDTIETLHKMRDEGVSPKDMAKLLGVHLATIYRYLNEYDKPKDAASRPSCSVCRWLDQQDESSTVINEVNAWVRRGHLRDLFHTLKRNGLSASETTFRNHAQQCVLNKESAHVAS